MHRKHKSTHQIVGIFCSSGLPAAPEATDSLRRRQVPMKIKATWRKSWSNAQKTQIHPPDCWHFLFFWLAGCSRGDGFASQTAGSHENKSNMEKKLVKCTENTNPPTRLLAFSVLLACRLLQRRRIRFADGRFP